MFHERNFRQSWVSEWEKTGIEAELIYLRQTNDKKCDHKECDEGIDNDDIDNDDNGNDDCTQYPLTNH